ncbi:hypothetical protein SDC9_196701 [bioreactor metagenome]|uniref:Uncharacterized protein n=1 Tax=bioreactor metagenome TaxID=1076179 RepID=A0A645ICQ3_9ZZZZ
MNIFRADAVDGRDKSAENMIYAVELRCSFNGHHIADVFDHADYRPVADRVGTNRAGFGIADVVAGAAIGDVFAKFDQAVSQSR